jgi:hypothetical protein
MNKIIICFVLVSLIFSCKEAVIKKPENLIEKEVMVDILYDLSLLEAINFQTSKPLEAYKLTPSQYIYQKYKIDSLQFAQNNMYYAADYKAYKKMNEQINTRLDKNKILIEGVIKKEKKRALLLEKSKSKRKKKSETLSKI